MTDEFGGDALKTLGQIRETRKSEQETERITIDTSGQKEQTHRVMTTRRWQIRKEDNDGSGY